MSKSSIEWTDETWNPIRGCSMAAGSEDGGCLNCYAARYAARNLPEMRSPTTGEPFAVMRESGPRWTGRVELIRSKLDEPLHWRRPRKVFVNSTSDLFHERLPDQEIDHVFAVMMCAREHTFQILTKRGQRMLSYLSDRARLRRGLAEAMKAITRPIPLDTLAGVPWPLPNVWLGVSVEDQKTWNERIPLLQETPAALRFISLEPMLAPVKVLRVDLHGIAWLILGGESGPGARPFDVAWARSVIRQCREAGVPCFVKQLGARPVESEAGLDLRRCWTGAEGPHGEHREPIKHRKGGDPSEWPEDLRVREWPE